MNENYILYDTNTKTKVSICADKTSSRQRLHFHSSYEIYLTHSGPMSCVVNNKTYSLMPGDMLVFAPADIHMSVPPQKKEYVSTVLNFSPDKIIGLSDKTDLIMPFGATANKASHKVSLSEKEAAEYIEKLGKLKRITAKEFGDDVREQILLAEIMLFVCSLYNKQAGSGAVKATQQSSKVFDILRYINANISGDLSLAAISDRFNMSINILNKHFKRQTGYTLGQYIIHFRMFCAKRLIMSGESVYNTAWKVGYQNTSNFIRTYKKVIGATPGKMKEGI